MPLNPEVMAGRNELNSSLLPVSSGDTSQGVLYTGSIQHGGWHTATAS
jgi:hypothetical protein